MLYYICYLTGEERYAATKHIHKGDVHPGRLQGGQVPRHRKAVGQVAGAGTELLDHAYLFLLEIDAATEG